ILNHVFSLDDIVRTDSLHTIKYTIARRAAQDIIFSCCYYSEIPDSKFLIIYLLQRYTTFTHYSPLGIYFINLYDLYIDTDYQVEDLINLPEELELLKTLYISNSSLQLTQYSDPTNITYLEDSFFSKGSISYQLSISTSLPESVVLNPNFSISCELFSFKTDQILDQIDIEANSTTEIEKSTQIFIAFDVTILDILLHNVNLIEEETTFIKIEIPDEDSDQDLEIIEEIHLGVKKGTKEILEIIIIMTEADLEIIITIIKTGLEDTLLNNTSIRRALANYLQGDSNIVNLVHSNRPRTIPVKYQTTIYNKLFTAIIDSEAAISMIIQQAAKEIGLEIDTPSNSLILSAFRKQVRSLGVIKDVSIEIAGITIPIFMEVVSATTYSLILENDWSHKAIERQPIVSKVDDDWKEEYKDKELISHEAYILEAESNNIEDSG
ncbi:32251_t:CDS:2, partial [Racocetra persica]